MAGVTFNSRPADIVNKSVTTHKVPRLPQGNVRVVHGKIPDMDRLNQKDPGDDQRSQDKTKRIQAVSA